MLQITCYMSRLTLRASIFCELSQVFPLSTVYCQLSTVNCLKYNPPMRFLFLFMDGIGFGADDPETNPFAAAKMPNLTTLLDGKRLVAGVAPLETSRATLLELDAGLGVQGLPQSATGQAALLTGHNVPQLLGEHYGPKPSKAVAAIIKEDNLFIQLQQRGYRSALLNAYPH